MTIVEQDWVAEVDRRQLPRFCPGDYRRVAAVAAHPDDETLGASGCMQAFHAAGCVVRLIVATDGEAAFPALDNAARTELGRRRRTELTAAMAAQGLGNVEVRWLGLPDSGLAASTAELAALLEAELSDVDCVLLPWRGDLHPDHRAVAEAALRAAPVTAHRWAYPIWMWHWMRHGDEAVPWQHGYRYVLSDGQRARKKAAIATFESQLAAGPDGSPPILPPEVLEHFDRESEVLFREPRVEGAPVARFSELYGAERDPWQTESSWYERRKRVLLLASLPRERYRYAVEPACGIGTLTADLAERCDELFAFDPVESAVKVAAEKFPGSAHVRAEVGALPADLPAGPTDLIVVSEILYYLAEKDFDLTMEALVEALEPGGDLVAVHWRHWAPEATCDGATAHARLLRCPEFECLVEHQDEDFLLHVLRRR